MNVLVGLLQPSPSSSSKDESPEKNVVLPPSGPVTRGFGRTTGVASGAPYLSRYVGMPPAEEKSFRQAGMHAPGASCTSAEKYASNSSVRYQELAPIEATFAAFA
jgi:hypothetical protein